MHREGRWQLVGKREKLELEVSRARSCQLLRVWRWEQVVKQTTGARAMEGRQPYGGEKEGRPVAEPAARYWALHWGLFGWAEGLQKRGNLSRVSRCIYIVFILLIITPYLGAYLIGFTTLIRLFFL